MSEAWLGKLKRKNMDTAMMQPKTDALIISQIKTGSSIKYWVIVSVVTVCRWR